MYGIIEQVELTLQQTWNAEQFFGFFYETLQAIYEDNSTIEKWKNWKLLCLWTHPISAYVGCQVMLYFRSIKNFRY